MLDVIKEAEGCLKSGQFSDFPYVAGQQQQKERDKNLEEHRAIIYRDVVQPLQEDSERYSMVYRDRQAEARS